MDVPQDSDFTFQIVVPLALVPWVQTRGQLEMSARRINGWSLSGTTIV